MYVQKNPRFEGLKARSARLARERREAEALAENKRRAAAILATEKVAQAK